MVKSLSIFTKLSVPFLLLDENFVIQGFSDGFLKEFSAEAAILGLSLKNLSSNLPENLIKDVEGALWSKNVIYGEGKLVSKEGKLQWYKWEITTVKEEDITLLITIENHTKSKIAEELYKTSEQVSRTGSWEADLINNTLYWSDMTKIIHEVPLDYVPSLETGINFYKAGRSRDVITQCVEEGILTGKPWDVELQIVTQKGRVLWVHAKGDAERENGRCVRLFGTFQDIDAQKRAELEYQKMANRLTLATAKTGIGIWEFDLKSQEVFWDETLCKIFGYQKEDYVNIFEYWKKNISKNELKKIYEAVDKATPENNKYNATYMFDKPGEGIRWIKAVGTILFNSLGEKIKVIGVSEDITEIRRTQLKLSTVEKSMETTFYNSTVGMALVETEGVIKQVNTAFCKSFGYIENYLIGKNIRTFVHPDEYLKRRESIKQVVNGRLDNYQEETRFLNKEGGTINVILNVTPYKNFNDNVTHLVVQLVDITNLKETKKKLEGLLDISSKQNESLLNFAHIVSHNLRSHASNLMMITSLMLDDDIEEEERMQTIKMLQEASDGLNDTIVHLNEVVQVKTNANIDLKPIQLQAQINAVVQNLAALIEKSGVSITICCNQTIKVAGVTAYVESIIHNLITNAIKYRDSSKKAFIKINVSTTARKVKLTVEDNGLGIDLKKHRSKLFGMYKTFHNHPEAKGVGLYIVKNQVEAMGGKITVKSELKKGSTFTVELNMAN
ncbi:PAS domain-containing sensor histidine kinase [Croceivirga sp. JEA036]|uniref:PAS domain-containing sensor histidine kinase n=1 Tax=Croceivirga sp. JEA036 TaxID=2721162 RepID=UPI001439878E|nr:PAS domain-containing sensor histidine kinase [Croceivirga sp. JEA036]NJB36330.1 PAS domain S-box protein [Croceivirga sp. JEA036]